MTHFEKLMKRRISLLGSDLFIQAWNDKKLFFRRTGFATYVSNFEFIDCDAWFDMDWFEEVISSHWNDKPEVFFHFTRRGHEAGEKLVRCCREMNLEGEDRQRYEALFWKSAKLFQDLSVFIPITHPLSKLIEKKVIELLKNHGVTDEQMTDKLLEVSVPDKRNGPELELIDLKRIKKHLTDPGFDVENALREHWKKYAYLGYRDVFSSGYSIDFFRSSLQEKDLNEMGLTHPPLLEFNFSPDELQVIHLLKEFVWFRNYRTERFFEGMFFLEPLWKQLSLSFGLGEHDLFYYLTDEVSKLFTHGDKVPVADLEQRKQGSALLLDDNHFLLLTGDLLKQKESAIQEVDESASQEIKGMVVCRGECQGPVSIVHNDSELDKVNDGDILVTGMTTPDYIPALRKAAAFVTDEGGVTCHAAIVAREMKKPCIVGTKHATQILKDRELVQVDANAGIVKIIS